MDVKYRVGYPTVKALNELINAYFDNTHKRYIHLPQYSPRCVFQWHRTEINEKIDGFRDFLGEHGVQCEEPKMYEYPRTGSMRIKKKD